MESFSITSKCCFRGLFTLPKNISWGNTEMLLCTYCIGQSPKTGNGNGFWHHCWDSGMIIILASSMVGSMSESFCLFRFLPLSLCIGVFVCLRQGMEIQDSCRANASWVSSHLPLSCSPLSPFSVFSCPSLLLFALVSSLWLSERGRCVMVDIQHGSKLGQHFWTTHT